MFNAPWIQIRCEKLCVYRVASIKQVICNVKPFGLIVLGVRETNLRVLLNEYAWYCYHDLVLCDKALIHFVVPQVKLDDRVVHTDRGLLIRSLQTSDAGVYVCVAQEHTDFTHTLLRLKLQLVTNGQLDGKPKPSEDPAVELRHGVDSRQYYKDYLRVMSSPFGSLEEYCDSLWLEKRPTRIRGRGLGAGKWKHIQEMKKSRNRRQHREREEERDKQERGRVVRTANQWRAW